MKKPRNNLYGKKLPDTNLNVVVRVVLETDEIGWKNSVMTFYRIREKNLKKINQEKYAPLQKGIIII